MKDRFIASWDKIAEDWTQHADINDYKNFFLMPKTLEQLTDVEGKHILDLGCGEGSYSRALARKGAKVTSVDASAKLIEVARIRARDEDLDIEHHILNAVALNGLQNESFDLVLASMILMDVENYRYSIMEIHRVLKPGGELFVSILHPCFSGKNTNWEKDEEGKFKRFIVEDYFKREIWEAFITNKFREKVLFRHMPLEDFINPLIQAGFKLISFQEPKPTSDQSKKSKRLKELLRVPLFLFMKWKK
jgi:2-polyprenyl-3-methyl-5-hydroxy-6-metoxy-1,4-benzoquinol methylase